MQTTQLRADINSSGLVPAGALFERLARDLREANARKAAASAKLAAAYRTRDSEHAAAH